MPYPALIPPGYRYLSGPGYLIGSGPDVDQEERWTTEQT